MFVCVFACKTDVATPALVQSSTGLFSKANSFIVSAYPERSGGGRFWFSVIRMVKRGIPLAAEGMRNERLSLVWVPV